MPIKLSDLAEEIVYGTALAASNNSEGEHHSREAGAGVVFSGHKTILEHMAPARIDMLRTAAAFDKIPQVRAFEQRHLINLVMMSDFSASMAFTGRHSRWRELLRLTASFAYSAYRRRDAFGFVGYNRSPLEEFAYPPLCLKAYGREIGRKMENFMPEDESSEGCLAAADLVLRYVAGRPSLVIWVSDFHFRNELIERTLAALSAHDLVPIVLWDPMECSPPDPPAYRPRIIRLVDSESGREQLVVWRRKTAERHRRAFQKRKETLTGIFSGFGRAPLFIVGETRAQKISQYFIRRR